MKQVGRLLNLRMTAVVAPLIASFAVVAHPASAAPPGSVNPAPSTRPTQMSEPSATPTQAAGAQSTPKATDTAPAQGKSTTDAPGAQGTPAQAAQHKSAGEAKFKAGDFAAALVEFQAADAIEPTARLARYIAICHDNLNQYQDAVAAYERFLAAVPPNMASQESPIRNRVAMIRSTPATIQFESSPTGARIVVDGAQPGLIAPASAKVAGGKHTVDALLEGYPTQTRTIDVGFATNNSMRVDFPAPAAAATVPAAATAQAQAAGSAAPGAAAGATAATAPADAKSCDTCQHAPNPAWWTGGIAVASAGVGTAFGVLALQERARFRSGPTEARANAAETYALVADIAFGTAIVFGVTSAVLWYRTARGETIEGDCPDKKAPAPLAKRLMVAPLVTAHGGGGSVGLQF